MDNDLAQAVRILRSGGLVAFPTETVYGLGADATNAEAVRRIFAAKGRPDTNPLIVHVADVAVAQRYSAHWPAAARKLAARFWPGPLTLVLRKSPLIVAEATAGLETVGLRAPDHPLTLELLRQFDGPLAGPSANRSTRVSPTTAQHVRDELGDAVGCIVDGGPCRVGIESTVLDLSGDTPTILRPGAVTAARIEAEIGAVRVFSGAVGGSVAAMSPGQQAMHYAPLAEAYRFDARDWPEVLRWCRLHSESPWAVMTMGRERDAAWTERLSSMVAELVGGGHRLVPMPPLAEEYGRLLYAVLRNLDGAGVKTICIEMPPDEPQWTAIRDRLRRATRKLPG